MSMYVSSGPPGSGVLCVTAQRTATVTVQSTAQARSGAIGYAGTANGILYLAVRPSVERATVDDGSGSLRTYTLEESRELQLQLLTGGWHAADVGLGISSTSLTLRAYNLVNQLKRGRYVRGCSEFC